MLVVWYGGVKMSLVSKSNLNGGKVYKYKSEKRFLKRVKFEMDVMYPRINDESVYEKYGGNDTLLKACNISEYGICFKSVIPLKKGDFINFSLALPDKLSMWCLAVVRWINLNDEFYVAGCEFVSLTLNQINNIKEYIKNNE